MPPPISDLTTHLLNLNYSNQILGNYFPNIRNFDDKYWNFNNSNNYFKSNDLELTIKQKLDSSTNNSINTNDFGQLVNLTAFNHFLDGFNYFKCFLKSLLNNDFKVSTHLLYYSELRWLNSLLTSQGFVCFDKSYLISTPQGFKNISNIMKSYGSSHTKAWSLFQAWADLNQSDDLLNRTFLFNGISYKSWLNAGEAPYSSKLLMSWLTDLHNQELPYTHDKNLRNEFSYQAHRDFSIFETPNLQHAIEFLFKDLNQIFSLDENSNFFEYLDREVFFMSVQAQFSNQRRETRATNINHFFKKACKNLSMDESYATILADQANQTSDLSTRLRNLANTSDIDSIKFMFYRAILLMRLACSSLKNNLISSGKENKDIQAWFHTKLNNSPWIRETVEDSLLDYSCELEDFLSNNSSTFNDLPKTLWELPPETYSNLLKFTDLDVAAVWSFN